MTITGKIYAVGDIETGQGAKGEWKKQQVVVEIPHDKYPKKVAIEIWGDLTKMPFEVGKDLSVEADVESREHKGRWYTTVKGYKVVSNDSNFTEKASAAATQGAEQPKGGEIDDDLPF